MKYVTTLFIAAFVALGTTAVHGAEPILKDMIAHFEKSGMKLGEVGYLKKLTNQQKKQGILEGVNVSDDWRKRKKVTEVQYMFNILRVKDKEALGTRHRFAASFKKDIYINGFFVLSFQEDANKDKVLKIFNSFKKDMVTQTQERPTPTVPKVAIGTEVTVAGLFGVQKANGKVTGATVFDTEAEQSYDVVLDAQGKGVAKSRPRGMSLVKGVVVMQDGKRMLAIKSVSKITNETRQPHNLGGRPTPTGFRGKTSKGIMGCTPTTTVGSITWKGMAS
jgi:hypothetical protein